MDETLREFLTLLEQATERVPLTDPDHASKTHTRLATVNAVAAAMLKSPTEGSLPWAVGYLRRSLELEQEGQA